LYFLSFAFTLPLLFTIAKAKGKAQAKDKKAMEVISLQLNLKNLLVKLLILERKVKFILFPLLSWGPALLGQSFALTIPLLLTKVNQGQKAKQRQKKIVMLYLIVFKIYKLDILEIIM
jgi:hypothetical protein